jgi:TRAP-type C4-dicarboxylate transport system permease small subunit
MIDRLSGAVRALLEILRSIAGVLLICSVALNFANIIGRYFFSVSISWAEEIMLFLMVGCVFLGSAQVAWANRQIRMDIIVNMMPAPIRKSLELLADLVFLGLAGILVVFAWPVIMDLAAFDERSQAANFPLVIPQALVPIGLTLMAFLVAVRLLTRKRTAAAERPAH